jgi:hypothetical protein
MDSTKQNANGSSSKQTDQAESSPQSMQEWVDKVARLQLDLNKLKGKTSKPVVDLSTGKPLGPLPQLLATVKRQHGWLSRFVPDPAYSDRATLGDFYKRQQRVYVCLPHVSAEMMLAAATIVTVVLEQALLCNAVCSVAVAALVAF